MIWNFYFASIEIQTTIQERISQTFLVLNRG